MHKQTISVVAIILIISMSGCGLTNQPTNQPTSISASDSSKPNIILIITDDQPPQSIEYMPNVQKELVGRGVTFTNGFVTTPLCCPSRSSIFTGLYVHNHGVKTNRAPDGGATVFNDASTIAVWMQQAGYRTALMGKYLNGYNLLKPHGYVPPGWNEWHVFYQEGDNDMGYYYGYTLSQNGEIVKYSMDSKDYSADVLTAKALKFIKDSGDQPYFLVLSYFNPHQTYQAADRYKNYFKTDEEWKAYRPPNFLVNDLSGKPQWLQTINTLDAAYIDKVYQRMLRSLMAVDDAVGKITNLLDKRSERNNTAIIYMSDNGMSLGENTFFGKNCQYDPCIHVPFIVSYPSITASPRIDDHLVLNIDLAPTIIDLAGSEAPTKVDGVSFVPLLKNPSADWRNEFLIEHFQDLTNSDEGGSVTLIPTFYGIRSTNWKYVEYDTGEIELYNLKADPYEMNNLSSDTAYSNIVSELHSEIEKLKSQ